MTATARPIPESPPVTSATFPESLPAGLYRGASYFGRGSSSASIPGLSSFCFGNGGFGSDLICGCDMSLTKSNKLASAGRPVRGNGCGARANNRKERGNRDHRSGMPPVQPGNPGGCELHRDRGRGHADDDGNGRETQCGADDKADHVAPRRAERKPNRHFAPASRGQRCHHAVNANRRQKKRERGECTDEPSQFSRSRERLRAYIVERPLVECRLIRIDGSDSIANQRDGRLRWTSSANDERHDARRILCIRQVQLRIVLPLTRSDAVFADVAHDTDYRQRARDRARDPKRVTLRKQHAQPFADDVHAAPESARERSARDRDAETIVRVGGAEVPACERRDADCLEISGCDDPAERQRFASRLLRATIDLDWKRGRNERQRRVVDERCYRHAPTRGHSADAG